MKDVAHQEIVLEHDTVAISGSDNNQNSTWGEVFTVAKEKYDTFLVGFFWWKKLVAIPDVKKHNDKAHKESNVTEITDIEKIL